MPASSWSCLAARAASEQPITSVAGRLPRPRGRRRARRSCRRRRRLRRSRRRRPTSRSSRTIRSCSSASDGRPATAASTASALATPVPASRRPIARCDELGPRVSSISGVVQRISSVRAATTVPSSRRMAAWVRSAPTARTCSERRNPSTRSRTWSTRPPAGRALQTALMTSRSPNVLTLAVRPSGLASHRYSRSASAAAGRRAARWTPSRSRTAARVSASRPRVSARAPPSRQQAPGIELVVLGSAGGVGGELGGPGRVLAVLVEVRLDLPAAGRELPEHRSGDAGDVGDAVADRPPLDTETAGQLPAQVGFVEVPDRRQPRVQRPGVQRGPPVVARRVGEVGDHDMGVQMRIAGPGGAVPERGGDEPVAVEHRVAALAAPHPARGLFEDRAARRRPRRRPRCGPRWTPPGRRGRTAATPTSARRTSRRTRRPSAPTGPRSAGDPLVGSTCSRTRPRASASTSPSSPSRGAAAPIHWPGASLAPV